MLGRFKQIDGEDEPLRQCFASELRLHEVNIVHRNERESWESREANLLGGKRSKRVWNGNRAYRVKWFQYT